MDRQGSRRLESGVGPVALLMRAIEYHIVGLARGRTLIEQIRNRREAMALTKREVAVRSGVTPATVERLEAGEGRVASLIRVLKTLKTSRMARNKPQAASLTPLILAEKDKRFTPIGVLKVLETVWGDIDLDPCAHPESSVRAKRRIMLQEGGDGLKDRWRGDVVYLNPPFSAASNWLGRADEMWREGYVETVVALVPTRIAGAYFHDQLSRVCHVGFIRGRLQFARGECERDLANRVPFPLMTCIWGATREQIAHFTALCLSVWLERRHD